MSIDNIEGERPLKDFGPIENQELTEIDLDMKDAIEKVLADKVFLKELKNDLKKVQSDPNYSEGFNGISDKIFEKALSIIRKYVKYAVMDDKEFENIFNRKVFKDNIERKVYEDTYGEDLPDYASEKYTVESFLNKK